MKPLGRKSIYIIYCQQLSSKKKRKTHFESQNATVLNNCLAQNKNYLKTRTDQIAQIDRFFPKASSCLGSRLAGFTVGGARPKRGRTDTVRNTVGKVWLEGSENAVWSRSRWKQLRQGTQLQHPCIPSSIGQASAHNNLQSQLFAGGMHLRKKDGDKSFVDCA